MSLFSDTLARLRKKCGFKSAYSFYHDNGGRKAFGLSYPAYTMAEQGKHLPAFERLPAVIRALRLMPASAEGVALTLAWLKTAHGADTFRDVIAPVLKQDYAQPRDQSPLVSMLRKHVTGRTVYATPEQLEAIVASRENFLCSMALSSDSGAWSAREVAREVRIPPKAAAESLQSLAAAGILKRLKPGVYTGLWADATVQLPWGTIKEEVFRKLAAYESALRKDGTTLFERRLIMRMDPDELHDLYLLISTYLSSAKICSADKSARDSSWISLEGRVIKLRDF